MLRLLFEFMFGVHYLKKLYKKNYHLPQLQENFWGTVLQLFNIKYKFHNNSNLPKYGPSIIVCNHPFGIVDGLIIANEVHAIRKDFKILINEELNAVDHIKNYLLPLQFDNTKESIKNNIVSKNKAIEFINQGGCVIIFPSGEVATREHILKKAVEKEWKSLLGSIVRKTKCSIYPVKFDGENSFLFQLIGIINYKARRIMFAKELINKKNKMFWTKCGLPIPSEEYSKLDNPTISSRLRSVTLSINQQLY